MLVNHKQFESLNGPILDRNAMYGHTRVLLWTVGASLGLVALTYVARLLF